MLNYKSASIVTLIFLLICVAYNIAVGLSIYVYLLIILIYLSTLVYGSAKINSNFYVKALCSSRIEKKEIALTFDDGPDKNRTIDILRIMNKYNAQAAFFMVGEKVIDNPEILKKVHESMHIIGNHSYSHSKYFDLFTASKMIEEFEETENIVCDIIGKRMNLFRPPYGVTNPSVRKALSWMNYTCIGWNIRSFDTSTKNVKNVLERIKKKIKPGAIILLHDTSDNIVEILEELLKYLKQNNYNIIRLDKLLSVNAYK